MGNANTTIEHKKLKFKFRNKNINYIKEKT